LGSLLCQMPGASLPLRPPRVRELMAPDQSQCDPESFPPRTPPDADGKPRFVIAGDEGPPAFSDEKRRHYYKAGVVPIKIKVMRKDGDALIWYRVSDDGVTGWQLRKPLGFRGVPFIGHLDPFDPERIDEPVYWPEGEKDTDSVTAKGALAITFGGVGDGLPADCEAFLRSRHVIVLADNDAPGRKHAEEKAALAFPIAASVRVVHFTEVPPKGDVSDYFQLGGTLETLQQIVSLAPLYSPRLTPDTQAAAIGPVEIFWHGVNYNRAARQWLVKDLIPQMGQGLVSGQWGTAKTFAALDLSASIMTATPFAGRDVIRRGGVLFIAAEGASEIPIRLQGVVDQKLRPSALAADASSVLVGADLDRLPFAWIEECPSLGDEASFERLCTTATTVASQVYEQFGVPLALIVVDTVAASADFIDANDAAECQRIMGRLNTLSRRTGAFSLGLDHFGKVVETGTRGSSAKEAAADVVLALLADRDLSGTISKTRMAVRKLRGGVTGTETPFDLRVVEIGPGETTCVIDWKPSVSTAQKSTSNKERWPKSLRIFRSAMHTALISAGTVGRPYGSEGPAVRMVADGAVRTEFMAIYPVDADTDKLKADAKRQAFNRALKAARDRSLVCSREIPGVDHLWLVDEQDKTHTHTDGPDTP
jgi:hypothetical protein